MLLLDRIYENYKANGDRVAYESCGDSLTYKELWEQSDRLAFFLWKYYGDKDEKQPVIVYGHKRALMPVCFLACAKAGRAYCPVDTSMPDTRVRDIAETIGNPIVLATEDFPIEEGRVLNEVVIRGLAGSSETPEEFERKISPEDTYYIIFTSGSTGKPKGVEISYSNLSCFADWSADFFPEGARIMNQAPFSFDLSVMDTYSALAGGCSLYGLPKELQKECGQTLEFIRTNRIQYLVSTPSFVNMLLVDKTFCEEVFPDIVQFLFCGERLTKETVRRIWERFPNARIINTYGPTESRVAVTSVEITGDMLDTDDELPIGRVKPGSRIIIEDDEIIICGDTVSSGYFRDEEKTGKTFFEKDGMRCYRSGDRGYFRGDMLYYTGRKDNQIKLHGYRIELGDIESNLIGINGITEAAVLPKMKDGTIKSLTAFVAAGGCGDNAAAADRDCPELTFQEVKEIKARLAEKLPAYMIPKKIRAVAEMPRNINGKTDRKRLEQML